MRQDLYINRPLDFNKLDHREFEEVVYYYFKDQINKGFYAGIYDNVELSSGVGERGADAILFLQGFIKGVVQCKRYKTNIGVDLALSEIIKFLLYHILETQKTNKNHSSLINEIQDFTYYLVVSKDFTQKTKSVLASFNSSWKEQKISKIYNAIITNRSFLELDKTTAYSQLETLLDNLKVVMITAVDLDPIVRVNSYLQNRYFSLSKLVNAEQSKHFSKNAQDNLVSISSDTAIRKTDLISNDITRIKSFFGTNEKLSIERPEVDEIIKWIHKKPKPTDSNIAVIAGNAGMGKTVILSQLYLKLKTENVPVISLKADRLIFNSLREFEIDYNLDVGFESLFNQLLGTAKTGVLLIDQIDALSQSLSSDLRPLKFYDNLIQRFNQHPRIKIIISTRIYDLNYDPIIANYKGKKSFIIKPLDRTVLVDVLEKFGIKKDNLYSNVFLDLIAVPLHLDVFLNIYTDDLKIDEIKSLQDLYSELWKQKILDLKSLSPVSTTSKKLSKFIFKVASKMYELQEINLDVKLFEDKFFDEIHYLKSEGILANNDKIEFFHQSFFDYSFARNFVNSKKNLTEDILSRHQGLFIRSKVKQILNYKQGVIHSSYIGDIREILVHRNIRFHIKLLVIQQIAFQEKPSVSEQDCVEEIIFNDQALKTAFAYSIMSNDWLSFYLKRDVYRKDIEENNHSLQAQITRSFRCFTLVDNRSELLEYYTSLKNSAIKDELILDYFWQVSEIKNELAITLIKEVFSRTKDYQSQYWYYRVLEHAVQNFPHWVAQELKGHIDIPEGTDIVDDKNYFYPKHQGSQIYESFWEKHPDIAYKLVKDIIQEIISKRKYQSERTVIGDSAYIIYDRKNNDLYKHYEQLDRLQTYLENKFKTDEEFVKKEVKELITSNYITEIIIAFSVILKYPSKFAEEGYRFFTNTNKFQELYSANQYLNYMMLEVFGLLFYMLEPHQQERLIADVISNFRKNSELRVFTNNDGSKSTNKWFGIGKYELLSTINNKGELPKRLKKEYQELFRKFGKVENKEPEGTTVFINRDPLNANYNEFSIKDWKSSFKTYTYSNEKFDGWNQPSEYEHGRKFATVVSQNPNQFIDFIYQMIEDKEISSTYVVKALEGLKEAKVDVALAKDIFVRTIANREFDKESTLYLIWFTNYFSESKQVYPEILNFLREHLTSGDEGKENYNDALSAGINSARGAAASSLMDYAFSKPTFDFICNSLEVLKDNSRPSTRAAAIYKMQYLLQHGKERVLDLFLNLSDDYNAGLLKISINPLQYLVHYKFERLVPFFKEALKVKESHKEIGKLITVGYCNDYKDSDILLEQFLENNEPNTIIKTAFEFIEHNHKIDKALILVSRFLGLDSKEIGQIYDRAFFHIKPESFAQLREFLFQYVKSPIGKWREHPFYHFLLKCSGDYYNDCIKLAMTYKNHYGPDINQRGLRNEPLKVIVNAYNAIREYDKQSPVLEQAMDTFDDMLQNEDYRDSAVRDILKDVDAY